MIEKNTFPSFLFQPKTEVEPNTTLAYLADKLDLKNIVSELCKKLQHPVALIDYNALMKIDISEKLESMVDIYPMRRSCSVFRKCAGDIFCSQCDHFHARCMDIDKDSIEKRIQENYNSVPSFFYTGYRDRLPIVLEGFDRPVIEYYCPMLGYRELLFPLMYRSRVYGVFFAGQIMVDSEDDQNIGKEICKSFFKKNSPEELFETFVNAFNEQEAGRLKIDNESIKKLITNSDSNARLYDEILGFNNSEKEEKEYHSKNFKTKEDYYNFIGTVCSEIAETEAKLPVEYEKRRKRMVSKTLGKIADKYFEEYKEVHNRVFKNRHEAKTEELKSSWSALGTFAREILQQYTFVKKIYLFGDNQGIKIEESSKKKIVYFVTSEANQMEENKPEGSFDFSISRIEGISEYDNSIINPKILDGLSEGLPKENSILIQCHDIAMLIIVAELTEHKELYLSLTEAIEKELVRINNIIALCAANLMKEKYLLTLRMYRHENAHISTRLMGNIDRYLSNNGQLFLKAEEEKRKSIYNDMKNTVQLISNIADNISFVTGTGFSVSDPKSDVTDFDVADMLFKWQIMFRDELATRNLQILVHRGGYDSSVLGYAIEKYIIERKFKNTRQYERFAMAPKEILINARLFELLVYNLVDNAVKYAYRGTNIYLTWGRIENDYELSVTSYGPYMPEGDNMYGLYVRGNDVRFLQGDGLGLYVVKKISEKLDIIVSHKSKKISCYNAPLISWYSKNDFSGVKGYTKIEDSKLMLNSDAYQLELAINKYHPTEIKENDLSSEYLRKRIKMETWRTTFRIRIPEMNFRKNS